MSLLSIFWTAVLPIVTIAGVGFALGQAKDIDTGPLNTTVIYVLIPALVFHSLATTELRGSTLVGVTLGVLCFIAVMAVVAEGVGRALGTSEPLLGTFVLVSVFANTGNLGIPVAQFAFGATGRSTAVIYIVAQNIAMYTVGVYVAARGDESDWREGVRAVFAIPLVYVVAAALLARWVGVVPPSGSTVMAQLKLVGDAAIPIMLLILGTELADTDYSTALVRVLPATGLKLVIAPLVAVGVAVLVGFQNETVARVFVLQGAMPSAVTALILTGEFAGIDADLEPTTYAGTAILVTTLLAVPLLTLVIALLKSGLVV